MPEPVRNPALQSPEPPDTFFGLVAGLYVAILVSPALLVPVALWVSGDPAVLYVGLLTAVTGVTAVVSWGVIRWRGLPERLGTTRLTWLLPVLGVVATAGYFAVGVTVDAPGTSGVGIAGFFTGMFAMLLGIAILAMARSRYTAAVVDENAVEIEWTAGWPDRQRTWVVGVAAAAMIAAVLVFVLRLLGLIAVDVDLLPIVSGIAAGVVSLGTERTYRVTPAGLERRLPALRQFYPWDAFAGYSVTAGMIVVHWQSRWRIDVRCARTDLTDEDAVIGILDRYLERRTDARE